MVCAPGKKKMSFTGVAQGIYVLIFCVLFSRFRNSKESVFSYILAVRQCG